MSRSILLVRKDSYYDSVLLLSATQQLKQVAGVDDAVVAMGTPHNHELLGASGYSGDALEGAGPNDLVIAVRGEIDADALQEQLEKLLAGDAAAGEASAQLAPSTLGAAARVVPEANLVLISLPGEHAAREARRALALGKHVMIFSDNVSLADEVALKQQAVAKGLLMMGPDCGTAIINGKPLAFANVVRPGPIGVVGASGTGIQEVTSCIDRLGGGVAQAIGTGGRDLSQEVGGATMLLGIEALAADPATEVIVVISKPPAPETAQKVVDALRATPKPCVVHFVGAEAQADVEADRLLFADTLAGAAERACAAAGVDFQAAPVVSEQLSAELAAKAGAGAALRGLFCGGTTGYEALVMLTRAGIEVRSNLHKKGPLRIAGLDPVPGHAVIDLGEDLFTQGRPHPMIEPLLRNERLALEMADPAVGVLLFDVVLGYGSHEDPAGLTAEAVRAAREVARGHGRELVAIGSITGTHQDPQPFAEQRRKLEDAGVTVMPDNRRAVELATALLQRIER